MSTIGDRVSRAHHSLVLVYASMESYEKFEGGWPATEILNAVRAEVDSALEEIGALLNCPADVLDADASDDDERRDAARREKEIREYCANRAKPVAAAATV